MMEERSRELGWPVLTGQNQQEPAGGPLGCVCARGWRRDGTQVLPRARGDPGVSGGARKGQ